MCDKILKISYRNEELPVFWYIIIFSQFYLNLGLLFIYRIAPFQMLYINSFIPVWLIAFLQKYISNTYLNTAFYIMITNQ